jgi:hypothetical protein
MRFGQARLRVFKGDEVIFLLRNVADERCQK